MERRGPAVGGVSGSLKARRVRRVAIVLALAALAGGPGGGGAPWGGTLALAQQVGDSTFVPTVPHPAFARGTGPVVAIDEGHANFHTRTGRYAPFVRVLEADGFVVRSHAGPLTARSLAEVRLLVIANALNPVNADGRWYLPTPSALSDDEIAAVTAWVRGGGALFLIADHMPFAGAAQRLGAAFGARWHNGFALRADGARGPDLFRRSDGSLGAHPITRGGPGPGGVRIDSVATFTGSAFEPPAGATSLLTFPPGHVSLAPDTAWVFEAATPRVDLAGWSQGAVLDYGRGRVALFGEAAMFTAQRAGNAGFGLIAPQAGQSQAFLLQLVRWLTAAGAPAEARPRSSRAPVPRRRAAPPGRAHCRRIARRVTRSAPASIRTR
jgi:hypothetical protein